MQFRSYFIIILLLVVNSIELYPCSRRPRPHVFVKDVSLMQSFYQNLQTSKQKLVQSSLHVWRSVCDKSTHVKDSTPVQLASNTVRAVFYGAQAAVRKTGRVTAGFKNFVSRCRGIIHRHPEKKYCGCLPSRRVCCKAIACKFTSRMGSSK